MLSAYLRRQKQWSRRTFGTSARTEGICRHIEKELVEIRAKPHDLEEWIDVMILALDGYWRHGGTHETIIKHLQAKQSKNFARQWPPIQPDDQPTEHVKEQATC